MCKDAEHKEARGTGRDGRSGREPRELLQSRRPAGANKQGAGQWALEARTAQARASGDRAVAG